MTGRAAEPSYDTGGWAALSRRFSPYLDLTVGLAAAALSVASLVTTDVTAIDARLEPADALSVVATATAGLCLIWRRTRPITAFTVFVTACLVVTLTGHYIGLLSILLLFGLYSLAAHGSRRAGLVGLASSITVFIGLALLDIPDLRTVDLLQACALLLAAWALGDVVPMLLAGGAYGVALALGVADLRPLDITPGGAAVWGVGLLATIVFMTVLFLAEEIGWRGYMLPRLQQLTTRRRGALVTGFVHGCFHLPLILIATTYDEFGSRWFVAPVVVATLTMGGVFYAYLWDRTGSVWPVSMAHGAVNIMFGLGAAAVVAGSEADLAYVAGESGIATFAAVAVVAALFLARARVWRTDSTDSTTAAPALESVH